MRALSRDSISRVSHDGTDESATSVRNAAVSASPRTMNPATTSSAAWRVRGSSR